MTNEKVKLSNGDKVGLVSNLSTMLSAGIPILDVVRSMEEDSKGGTKIILNTLMEDITQGKHIYVSLEKFPRVFDKVTVNVVKASEEAGTLDVTLKDLRENIRKQNEFNDKVRSALIYPMFIIILFFLVLLVNLIYVIPKIAQVFKNLRVPLPLPTKILIFISDLMLKYTYPFLGGVAVVGIILYFLFTKKRNVILNIIYSLPLISELVKLIDLTRFTRSLHLLLTSGISITVALELAEDVAARRDTVKVIRKSRELVLGGKPFSEGLKTSKGYIPSLMIKLIEAGEKTGSLDKSLQDISEYFDYQVTRTLATLTALLEPIMLVIVGIVVGGLMISIIAPIYGLISQVGSMR